jgi:hypothetical protein
MKRHLSRLLAVALIAFSSACALSLRNAHISDLRQHPGRYEDRTVVVDGVVTDSWGVPLVPFKFYRVDDGTGEIVVLSDGLRIPGKGEHVRVKGHVGNVAVLGGRSLGLHLREEDLDVRRR